MRNSPRKHTVYYSKQHIISSGARLDSEGDGARK